MRKAAVYILLPVMILAFVSGCGMSDPGKNKPASSPMVSASPMTTPDVSDGIVHDKDGIITDEDHGEIPGTSASPDSRPVNPSPSASPSMTPNV